MAILTAATMGSNGAHRQDSKLMSVAGQVLSFASRSQQAIRSATQSLILRTYFVASFVLYYVLFVTQIFMLQSYSASRFVAVRATSAILSRCRTAWNSGRVRRLRKRIEFEFFLLILSPSGNNLFLLLFWPGWLVIAAAVGCLSIWAR